MTEDLRATSPTLAWERSHLSEAPGLLGGHWGLISSFPRHPVCAKEPQSGQDPGWGSCQGSL